MKAAGVFITGTDTGIGKTYCSCLLLQALNSSGVSTAAMKPIASGAVETDGKLYNEDALQLQAAASTHIAYEAINPYVFAPAIAPHIAAQQAGVVIELASIKKAFEKISQQAEFVVVEGVGGWQVPLNRHETVADLAATLALPVVLVVGLRLGCLSHALLSVESIERSGLSLAGWIANEIEPDFACLNENLDALKQHIKAPLLGHIRHGQQLATEASGTIGINISYL